MRTMIFFLPLWFFIQFIGLAWGISSHDTELTRNIDQNNLSPDSAITVTVNFTNKESADLNGFYYTDHVPAGLTVTTLSVKINEQAISDYILETGENNDVYEGYTPYRWIIETPPLSEENNAIGASAALKIIYTITSSLPGSYNLGQFSWAGYYLNLPENEKAAFGYSKNSDKITVTFADAETTEINAFNDNYTIEEGGTLIQKNPGGLLTNDIASNGNSLTAVLNNNVSNGFLTLQPDGTFTYIHDGSETVMDSFTYHAANGEKDSNIATATILIIAVNDAPIANDDSIKTRMGTQMEIDILQNDTDIDGEINPASIEIINAPSAGTAEVKNNGTINYSPNSSFNGTDSFSYTVKDNLGAVSNEARVNIDIETDSGGNSGSCFINISEYKDPLSSE